jgi:hypothetical protein
MSSFRLICTLLIIFCCSYVMIDLDSRDIDGSFFPRSSKVSLLFLSSKNFFNFFLSSSLRSFQNSSLKTSAKLCLFVLKNSLALSNAVSSNFPLFFKWYFWLVSYFFFPLKILFCSPLCKILIFMSE